MMNGIFGCALAAGLMTFAANQVQAGVVINNTLYSPLNLKLTLGVYNSKGDIKKMSVTSKQILKLLGYSKQTQLAINTGSVENNDVYIITKDSVIRNLTADGILTADVNELLDDSTNGNNGQFNYNSSGVLSLNFYSDPQFIENTEVRAEITINPSSLDQGASEDASDYWFEISGLYSYSEKGSAISKDGDRNISTKLKAATLNGVGFDTDLDAPSPTTVKGSATVKGNGKVPAAT